jgi:hypothetical protein
MSPIRSRRPASSGSPVSYARYLEPGRKRQDFAAKEGFMRDLVFCCDPWTLKERVAL